jgi:hypothetical protein
VPRPVLVICPYCGHESANPARCERCKGLTDPLSRQASQNAMGPWFIRDDAAPFRPGCSYDTLAALVAKGRVTAASIIRGPSTRQFWTRAANVPGIAHLLGQCHACHTPVTPDRTACPSCGASFEFTTDRQSLGLGPVRLLPGHAAPEVIARSMVEAVAATPAGERNGGGEAPRTPSRPIAQRPAPSAPPPAASISDEAAVELLAQFTPQRRRKFPWLLLGAVLAVVVVLGMGAFILSRNGVFSGV